MISIQEYIFYPSKSCTIILKFNHDLNNVLIIQVLILNTFTYLSHSYVFTTAHHVFLENNYPCFYYISLLLRLYEEIVKKGLCKFGIHYITMDMTYNQVLSIFTHYHDTCPNMIIDFHVASTATQSFQETIITLGFHQFDV